MNDGNIDASSAGTYALLLDTLRAGNRGGGYGGGEGGGYGYGQYANHSTIQHGIENNRQSTENLIDGSSAILGNSMDNNARSFDAATVAQRFNNVCDRISQSEFRNGDRLRDVEREMNINARAADKCCCETQKAIADAAKDAAKCCCDAKLLAVENKAEILASAARDKSEILLAISAIKDRELDAANAKITQLETINALNNNHHGGH